MYFMRKVFFFFIFSVFILASCSEKDNSNVDPDQITTQRSTLYNCVEKYLGPECVDLNLADVTVSIPGYPGCELVIRQKVYRCATEFVFGETRIVGLNGNCFELMRALSKTGKSELEWEEIYLDIKAALNKAAMDAHLATLTQTNLQVQTATLIESTCFKVCAEIDPFSDVVIPSTIQELYCGFGCCKKTFVVSNGEAIFESATELSPCNLEDPLTCNDLELDDLYPSCIMNCN
jgi:hypothetical protein